MYVKSQVNTIENEVEKQHGKQAIGELDKIKVSFGGSSTNGNPSKIQKSISKKELQKKVACLQVARYNTANLHIIMLNSYFTKLHKSL